MVDVHQIIAEDARNIIRKAMKQDWTRNEDWSVKPPDAIHIATATFVKANYLFSYDHGLLKIKHAGIEIREPFVIAPLLPKIVPGGT